MIFIRQNFGRGFYFIKAFLIISGMFGSRPNGGTVIKLLFNGLPFCGKLLRVSHTVSLNITWTLTVQDSTNPDVNQ